MEMDSIMDEPKTLQELFSKDDSWIQGSYCKFKYDEFGKIVATISWCLSGGINRIYGHNNNLSQEIYNNCMQKLGYILWGSLAHWNDEPGRTIDDIRVLVKELNI